MNKLSNYEIMILKTAREICDENRSFIVGQFTHYDNIKFLGYFNSTYKGLVPRLVSLRCRGFLDSRPGSLFTRWILPDWIGKLPLMKETLEMMNSEK